VLPRLAYIADVPVEASYHGSALLFRLLENYPPEKLIVIEGSLLTSQPNRRLPKVRYEKLHVGLERLLRTRFATWYSSWLTLTAATRASRINALLKGYKPDALLTVTHGYSWITAARFSAQHSRPFHMICHDDWARSINVISLMKSRLESFFGVLYRQAQSRLCVSPFMRDYYLDRYGAEGTLLLPCRAADCPVYSEPPPRLKQPRPCLTIAFGGTICSAGYARALRALGNILEKFGGRLLLFGPITPESARRDGLDRPNIEVRGLLDSEKLLRCFRNEVDGLFVPMSFDPKDRENMEISFPSKLTDYTASGVPMLIYGPPYSSAVRWATQNPGVAEVVSVEDPARLTAAIEKLAHTPSYRVELATKALEAGREFFSHEKAQSTFYATLTPIGQRDDI
jgi:hypothetical protein